MGFINKLLRGINKGKEEAEIISSKIEAYISSVDHKFSSKTDFIDIGFSSSVKKKCEVLKSEISALRTGALLLTPGLRSKKRELSELADSIAEKISVHNDEAASFHAVKAQELLGDVEGRRLDLQQLKCIVKPSSNHLVIAGAGTGKTTTIVGKVKYLLKSGACEAKDILVLSFTNASASEMRDRIYNETGQDITVCTFHKLGLDIIRDVRDKTPKISQIYLPKFVQDKLTENMKEEKYIGLLCRYYLSDHRYSKSEFDFQNKSEYDEYLHTNPPMTLNGEKVKSYGEMDIANFLFMNGISYEYEKEYSFDTRTKDRYQYYPDFYLMDSGCYIEYFGINENGDVPPYFSSRGEKSPSEEYREGMEWKRKTHKENNTVLIECYSYERSRGEFLSSLEEKLKKNGVEFKPLSSKQIWDRVLETNQDNSTMGISNLMATVISLMKSNEYKPLDLKKICSRNPKTVHSTVLVNLITPIYEAYDVELRQNDEIDFNDMINNAARLVRDGKYVNTYKYVIVDEYQDISRSRYNLIKALRDSGDYSLFCVGDDWQSIYRFTGSDLGYILGFSDYWGDTDLSRIETTYRFTDSLIEISGDFIMKNPSQIRKSLKSINKGEGFSLGEIKGFSESAAVSLMLERLDDLPENSTVFFIGRYKIDRNILRYCDNLECRYDNASKTMNVTYLNRPDLRMQFMTAHSSKGLQADYVFIINNKDKGLGFPSKIQDDPIVDVLLQKKESFPYAEERRLFYVAMTRARIKSFLVVVQGNESDFVNEIEIKYAKQLNPGKDICPLCGGILVKKSGPYGEFYGCSNYRTKGCKYKKSIKADQKE